MKKIIILFLLSGSAFAYQMKPLANNSLRKEIEVEKQRRLNINDWFVGAVDTDFYYRTTGEEEFFHGGGHWINLRTETDPSHYIRLNTRSLFYRGSVSYGYQQSHNDLHLVGVSLKEVSISNDFSFSARAGDLERQTYGAGLLQSEMETAGVVGFINYKTLSFKALKEGTGGIVPYSDLRVFELSYKGEAFKVGEMSWTKDEKYKFNRKPYYYISSKLTPKNFLGYAAEVGQKNGSNAYLGKLSYNYSIENLFIKLWAQYRLYEENFSDGLAGYTAAQYTGYDAYSKDFTNSINIINIAGKVSSSSGFIQSVYKLSDHYKLELDYEMVELDYELFEKKNFSFYRIGMEYSFNDESLTTFTIYSHNKVFNNSKLDPQFSAISEADRLFKEYSSFGANLNFLF